MLATGIILAGGKSSRFKSNKAMAKISSQRLIDRIIDVLSDVCSEIILVTNTPDQYKDLGIRTVVDIIPGKGPLSGMHGGLICSYTDLNFITACDLPFINKDILHYLLDQAGIYDDAVVPIVEGYPEPLAAVYRKTCIKPIEDALINNQYKVKSIFSHIKLKYIAEQELQQFAGPMNFFNINTQDDLRIALKQLIEK